MRILHRIALACVALAACAPPPAPPPPSNRTPVLAHCSSTEGPAGADTVAANSAGEATLRVSGAAGQHILHVPAGAAQPTTVFILTALAPPRVGVEAHVAGQETYNFLNGRRAKLQLSAQQCTDAEWGRLTSPAIVRIGPDSTLTMLPSQPEGGPRRILSTELPSLSGYAIGGS